MMRHHKVYDFVRPIDTNTSYCEMLQAFNKHQWSYDGVTWVTPAFNKWSDHNGGSAANWPRDIGRAGDERAHLSFWGTHIDLARTGGCCSSSTAEYTTSPTSQEHGWGQTFSMSYAIQLQPLPPNTGMTLVADVAGTTDANDAFWKEKCKSIPSNALFVVVDMGGVRDFFRQMGNVTFCTMLQAHNKHQWSHDGVTWVTPDFHSDSDLNGGSADAWPRDKGRAGDERQVLSRWSTDDCCSYTGGCCSSSAAEQATYPSLPENGGGKAWGQACK